MRSNASESNLKKMMHVGVVFPKGSLTQASTPMVLPREILTEKDKDELVKAKEELPELFEQFEGKKSLYDAMLRESPQKKGSTITVITVKIRDTNTGIERKTTLEDIKNIYENLRDEILFNAKVISGKASIFLNMVISS